VNCAEEERLGSEQHHRCRDDETDQAHQLREILIHALQRAGIERDRKGHYLHHAKARYGKPQQRHATLATALIIRRREAQGPCEVAKFADPTQNLAERDPVWVVA